MDGLTFRPVTTAEWPDMQALFSEKGEQRGCWCMYWRITRSEFGRNGGEGNRQAMAALIAAGHVPGILGYAGGRPIAWCAVAPRVDFPVLDRSPTLKRVDDTPAWSITCFFISRPYRGQGLSTPLIAAAVAYARQNGARIVEAYPIVPAYVGSADAGRYTGLLSTFLKAGFRLAVQRSPRRPIVRFYL
jgi:GNAT superfamily N-acetyltransferase